jgi:hypothetical protein
VKGQAQSVLAHDDGALVDLSASWDVRRRVGKSALYRATVEPGPTPTVVLRDASAWTIGRVPVPEQPEIRVPLNAGARVIGVRVDGTDRELVDGSALVRLDAQNAIAPVVVDGGRLGAFGELGDCNRFDQRSIDEVGLAVASSGTGDAREVELRAHDHAACVRAPVDVVAGDDVLVEIEARAVDGAAPRVCLWLSGPNTCAVLSGFTEDGSGWSRLHARYTIPAGVEAAALYLYADSPTASGASETITHYRAPHVGVVRALDALDVALPEPPVTRIDLDAGAHAVRNIAAIPPVALGDPSEVGDCNRTDPTTLAQVGITANVSGTSVRLHGDRHSACVHLPVDGMVPGATYRLHLEYRVTEGSAPARACLVGPDGKCTPLGALGVTAEWTDATFDVALPTGAAAGSDVRLYLYADAGTDPETVDYRDIAITPNGDESLTLITADATAAATPTIAWEEDGPARYRVHVENATAPFVVALSDTWSSDWKVRGLPEGGRVEQLRIDGYRNGWAVDAHGSYDLVLEYQPARWGRLALGISIVTMLVLLAGTVAMLGRRVHLRRRYRHVAPLFPNFDR